MENRHVLYKIICVVLVLGLVFGIGFAIAGRSPVAPENPIRQTAEKLHADPLDGGSSSYQRELQEQTEELPETEEQEEPENPEEEEPEEQQPEEPERPENPSSDGSSGPQETPGQNSDSPGENGVNPGPGSGENEGDNPAGEPGIPDDNEVKIATNLKNGTVTQGELPDGLLEFYAYGVGADDLSVRIRARNTASRVGIWLESEDAKNWSYQMELGEEYQFTLYLDQPGQPTQYVTRYVTYQAERASEENPVVGEFPPFITTNIDHYAEGAEIEGDNLALIVTVRSNPDYSVVTADKISVTLNGLPVDKHGGDANPEYDLFFEPPNVGDYRDYRIEIVAWYGNSSRYWSKTLRYHALAEGDSAGFVTIVLDATTVGVGILDEAEYEIVKGDTAADILLKFMEDYGYEITYDATGSNFYIRRIYRGDMCYGAVVPGILWEAILRDGINLNASQHDTDSLGEFDYTMGAGWLYAVDDAYPGRAMNRFEVKNGNTIYVRFTLAYGKDIGGFDATGGGYGSYSSYCGLWIGGSYQQLEHRYAETEHLEPSETEDGRIVRTCTRCGKSVTEVLPATGHKFEETARVEATETEDGYVEYVCAYCGEVRRDVLPATGGGSDPGTGGEEPGSGGEPGPGDEPGGGTEPGTGEEPGSGEELGTGDSPGPENQEDNPLP